MKITKIRLLVVLILLSAAIVAGVWMSQRFLTSSQVSLADVNEAQKVLMTLRRAQNAVAKSPNAEDLFARPQGGEVLYSKQWEALRLPGVSVSSGFVYECSVAKGVCQALEAKKNVRTGNAIQIELGSGVLSCLGTYQPVTTEGLDGKPVTVACQVGGESR